MVEKFATMVWIYGKLIDETLKLLMEPKSKDIKRVLWIILEAQCFAGYIIHGLRVTQAPP